MSVAKLPALIGIDLGTTYTRVGVFRNGTVEIIADAQGNSRIPSSVAFTTSGEQLIGAEAVAYLLSDPEHTIFDSKRFFGRQWSDPDVQTAIQLYPYKIINVDDKPSFEVSFQGTKHTFTPADITAMILGKVKSITEAYLGTNDIRAVISVPVHFSDAQRAATRDAGVKAGLTVLRIINEPTAAMMAYGLLQNDLEVKNILVTDLGGGSFDVSLHLVDTGIGELLATSGAPHFGGSDLDWRVVSYFTDLLKKKYGRNFPWDNLAIQQLRIEAEKLKCTLSSAQEAELKMELSSGDDHYTLSETLTREKFEELNRDLFLSITEKVRQVLESARMTEENIEVILIGGSSRIPRIQQLVREYFKGKEPVGKPDIKPDDAVAYGAALQAGIIGQQAPDILWHDVHPFTLGIETLGGAITKFVPRCSSLLTKRSQLFTTAVDNQFSLTIRVFQGERILTKGNRQIGEFELTDLPPAPRGILQVEVTFDMDANCDLHVSAALIGTDHRQTITIPLEIEYYREPREDYHRIIRDAEECYADDQLAKARLDARNDLESYAYAWRNWVRDKQRSTKDIKLDIIEAALADSIAWILNNPEASLEDFSKQKSVLDTVLQPNKSAIPDEEHPATLLAIASKKSQRKPSTAISEEL